MQTAPCTPSRSGPDERLYGVSGGERVGPVPQPEQAFFTRRQNAAAKRHWLSPRESLVGRLSAVTPFP